MSLATDQYCGACGAKLAGGIEERREQLEGTLAEAEQLRRGGRYEEAIALLEPVDNVKHARLEEYVDRASRLVQTCRTEREGGQARAEEALQQARHRVANHEYEAAAIALETIPRRLRTKPMQDLLDEANATLGEISSLDDELASAIASRGTLHLLPKVSRLLALQPDHAHARQLAERYRVRVRQSVEENIDACQYRAAQDVLDQLPETARTDEVAVLRQRVAEIVWLSDDLRSAPFVDKTLAAVARRMHALAPDDPRIPKLLAEVRRRGKIAASDPKRAYPPWASAPEKTCIEHPIDWLTGFRRVGIKEDLVESILVDHPGCLFVACGLALQGLGLGPIRLNLLPKEDAGPLRRIAGMLNEDPLSWVGRKRLPHSAWGLDFSASGLKAVKLVSQGEAGDVVIDGVDVVPHRKMLNEALNEDEAKTLLENTVQVFCRRNQVKADRIALGVTGQMVLSQRFAMPPLDAPKREKAIVYEARRRIPVPWEKVTWGYEVAGSAKSGTSGEDGAILLVAARRDRLLAHLAVLRDLGLRVDVVQSDFLALHNCVVYDRLCDEASGRDTTVDPEGLVALLDVGSDQTHLIVSSPTFVWHRAARFGGAHFSRALVREFQLTVARAEELKRSPDRVELLSRMYGALEPACGTLVEEVRSLLAAFARQCPGQQIQRVWGCGGSFQLHGLLRYLRSGF